MTKRAKRQQRGRDRRRGVDLRQSEAFEKALGGIIVQFAVNAAPFLQAISRLTEALNSEQLQESVRQEADRILQGFNAASQMARGLGELYLATTHLRNTGYLQRSLELNGQERSPSVIPVFNQPKVCRGCQHYHGYQYNSTPFVCAMHPYGPEAEHCEDRSSRAGCQATDEPPF